MRDYGKENVRRLREIQRRCKEQEAVRVHSQPVPVKALWSSAKYQNIPSRVMAQLQVWSSVWTFGFSLKWTMHIFLSNKLCYMQESGSHPKPQCQTFLRGHSSCASAGPAGIHRSASVSALGHPDPRSNAGDENQPVNQNRNTNLGALGSFNWNRHVN